MTQATLRAVTLKTVANYRHAAERAVGAYRAGGHRLIVVAVSYTHLTLPTSDLV